MHYRNGVENPRNIMRVHHDGREEAFAVVYDPDHAVEVVDALNSLEAARDAALTGEPVRHRHEQSGAIIQSTRSADGRVVNQVANATVSGAVIQVGGSIHGGVRA